MNSFSFSEVTFTQFVAQGEEFRQAQSPFSLEKQVIHHYRLTGQTLFPKDWESQWDVRTLESNISDPEISNSEKDVSAVKIVRRFDRNSVRNSNSLHFSLSRRGSFPAAISSDGQFPSRSGPL
jgi:hypothetical protein